MKKKIQHLITYSLLGLFFSGSMIYEGHNGRLKKFIDGLRNYSYIGVSQYATKDKVKPTAKTKSGSRKTRGRASIDPPVPPPPPPD